MTRPRPFVVSWRAAVLASELTDPCKVTLLALGQYLDVRTGTGARPSVATLQADTRHARSTVLEHLAAGVAAGYLARRARVAPSGASWPSEYVATMPDHRPQGVRLAGPPPSGTPDPPVRLAGPNQSVISHPRDAFAVGDASRGSPPPDRSRHPAVVAEMARRRAEAEPTG